LGALIAASSTQQAGLRVVGESGSCCPRASSSPARWPTLSRPAESIDQIIIAVNNALTGCG